MRHPGGIPGLINKLKMRVKRANIVTTRTVKLARWTDRVLEASASLENQISRTCGHFGGAHFGPIPHWKDSRLSYCIFGTKYQKNTRFST